MKSYFYLANGNAVKITNLGEYLIGIIIITYGYINSFFKAFYSN